MAVPLRRFRVPGKPSRHMPKLCGQCGTMARFTVQHVESTCVIRLDGTVVRGQRVVNNWFCKSHGNEEVL